MLFINPNMKKATPVRKLLDVMTLTTRSRYTCQLEAGEPGRGSLIAGVDGREVSRERGGEARPGTIVCSSSAETSQG